MHVPLGPKGKHRGNCSPRAELQLHSSPHLLFDGLLPMGIVNRKKKKEEKKPNNFPASILRLWITRRFQERRSIDILSMCSVFRWTWGKVCHCMTGLPLWALHLSVRRAGVEGSCSPLSQIFFGKSTPSWKYSKKITRKEENLMLGSPSHPDMSMTLKDLQLTWDSENKLHAGSGPALWDILCASTNTHSPPAREMGCTAPDPQSQLSDITFREVSPCLKSKTKLKPHFPEWLYSLKQHLPKLFHPSLASSI